MNLRKKLVNNFVKFIAATIMVTVSGSVFAQIEVDLSPHHQTLKDSSTYQSFSPAGAAGRVTSNYPVVQTYTTPATDVSHYHKMAYCPDPPICVNIRGEATTTSTTLQRTYLVFPPIDPDTMTSILQGNYDPKSLTEIEDNQDIFCPDQCIVTREVITIDKKISSVKEAICPDGYVQVGSFNMQDEIVYNPTVIELDSPIETIDKYNSYIDKGYDCYGDVEGYLEKCSTPSRSYLGMGDYIEAEWDYGAREPYVINGKNGEGVVKFVELRPEGRSTSRTFADPIYEYDPITVKTGGFYTAYCHDSSSPYDCSTDLQFFHCKIYCEINYYKYKSHIFCDRTEGDFAFQHKMQFYYQYQKCEKPVGFIKTENKAPASVVCARKIPVFKSL